MCWASNTKYNKQDSSTSTTLRILYFSVIRSLIDGACFALWLLYVVKDMVYEYERGSRDWTIKPANMYYMGIRSQYETE